MKINIVAPAKDRGSVLLVALVISAVLGITLASYLTLVSFQNRSVVRSQHWNKALVIAEAGIEEALQMVNKNSFSPEDLTKWNLTYLQDGWENSGQTYILPSRSLDAGSTAKYSLYVTNLNAQNTEVIIRSVGTVTLPSSVADNTTLSRTIVVRAKVKTFFDVAMAALGTVDLNGRGVATDSYHSLDPNYSTNGLYTKLRRRANGDIASNNTITNSGSDVGNASVAGHIFLGPFGKFDIRDGSVGSLSWVDAGTKGVEAGYLQYDMNTMFDNVELPGGWLPSGAPNGGTGGSGTAPDGIYYDHVFLSGSSGGKYTVADNGSVYIATNTVVTIQATVATYQPKSIYVAGTGAAAGKMIAFLTGTKAVLGSEHQSQNGRPINLQFFGLPSLTDISYSGNGNFSGVIYAPQASFSLNGGGSDGVDFCGSSVTKVVQMNGHYKFHYDESLRTNAPALMYKATRWTEL